MKKIHSQVKDWGHSKQAKFLKFAEKNCHTANIPERYSFYFDSHAIKANVISISHYLNDVVLLYYSYVIERLTVFTVFKIYQRINESVIPFQLFNFPNCNMSVKGKMSMSIFLIEFTKIIRVINDNIKSRVKLTNKDKLIKTILESVK